MYEYLLFFIWVPSAHGLSLWVVFTAGAGLEDKGKREYRDGGWRDQMNQQETEMLVVAGLK